jgi:hypothetical protein
LGEKLGGENNFQEEGRGELFFLSVEKYVGIV